MAASTVRNPPVAMYRSSIRYAGVAEPSCLGQTFEVIR
jgi:hypothetical protein